MQTVYIFNTTILTTPGLTYRSQVIDAERARRLVAPLGVERTVISAIGHESTAAIATTLLGQPVAVNRIEARMQPGDVAVCIKLRGRPPEGVILDREQVEAIGYEIVLLEAEDPRSAHETAWRLHIYAAWLALPEHTGDGEQPRSSRRRCNDWPVQQHFIVRLDDGSLHRLTQDWGTDEWSDQPAVPVQEGARVRCCYEHTSHIGTVMSGFAWMRRGGDRPAVNPERLGVVIDGVAGWHPIARVCTPDAATMVEWIA